MKKDDDMDTNEKTPEDVFDSSDEIQYSSDIENDEDAVKKLKGKLKICTEERGEYLDGWQRAKADLVNARKNFDAERIRMIGYATESLILEILPVIDSFEMAFSNKSVWETVAPNWRIGVEYIYQQLLKVLQEQNITQFNPHGEIFNPEQHTAIETLPTRDPEKDHTIIEVVSRGYKMHDKIIRPAQVKTARYEKQEN